MSFFKSMWVDLVEKRLWPVALVLLLALVAIPVLMGGGGAATGADLGTTAAGASTQTAQVSLEDDSPLRANRLGALRDPFKQAAEPTATGTTGVTGASVVKADTAGVTGGGASAGDTAAGTGTGGGDAGSSTPAAPAAQSGTTGSQGAPKAKAPASDARDSYALDVRFGVTGSKRPLRTIRRLTPLPSAENPYFIYLGVMDTGKVAFLLSQRVTANGDGTCKPSKTSCDSIELVPGDTEFFDVTDAVGTRTQYQLDVKRIDRSPSK